VLSHICLVSGFGAQGAAVGVERGGEASEVGDVLRLRQLAVDGGIVPYLEFSSRTLRLTDCSTIRWRRLDPPGQDSAMLLPHRDGWHLSGVAVFTEAGQPCRVGYDVACGSNWTTRRCSLRGHAGTALIALDIERNAAGAWMANGVMDPSLNGCDDIDLGFTPATNLLPIRRLELAVGASAMVNAAWVRFPELTTEVLDQVYTRLTNDRYLYESAGGSFRREIVVDQSGFVLDYPGLWRAETEVEYLDSAAAVAKLPSWADRHTL
jgi:uncharacterized protein